MVVDLNLLSLSDGLNVGLGDVLVGRESEISHCWVILSLNWSIDGWESSSDVLRGLNSDLLSHSSHSWLNEVTIDHLVSFHLYVFDGIFLSELGCSCDWVSVDDSVGLSLKLRSQIFPYSGNGWLNNYFLSGWLNDLLSDHSGLSDDSLCDDLWFGRNSLSDDSWLNSNSFGFYLCISHKSLHVLLPICSGLYFTHCIS